MSKTLIKRVVLAAIALLLAIGGVGYGLAWSAKSQCADALYEELSARNVSGRMFHGNRVLPTRDAVQAEVTAPFEVTVWTSVPRDLHATIYTKRFQIWPWGVRARKTQVFHTV